MGGQDDESGQQAVEPPDAPHLSAVAVPRRRAAEEILRRAVDRGELRAGHDRDLATDLLISPLFFRLAIITGPVDGPFLDRMTSALVAAMAAGGR